MRYRYTTEGQNLDFNCHFYFAEIQILSYDSTKILAKQITCHHINFAAEPWHLTVKT